jgi:outer membrane protein assembly factor BamE (lipoprotein component of BamABCDE complex)
MKHGLTVILIASVTAAGLSGCYSKKSLTRDRYETLYVSQPAWDVQRALGKPTSTSLDGNTWFYVHNAAPYYRAAIHFRDGKMVSKEWSYDRTSTSQAVEKKQPSSRSSRRSRNVLRR